VSNPEKYNFKPRQLLGKITDIYVHFASHPTTEFSEAVARDGRSYNEEVFAKIVEFLKGENIRSEVRCAHFVFPSPHPKNTQRREFQK